MLLQKSLLLVVICLVTQYSAAFSLFTEAKDPPIRIPQNFIHPGILQTRDDLEYVRKKVLEKDHAFQHAFQNLKDAAPLDFEPKVYTYVVRGSYGREGQGHRELSASANAAYCHALLWYITEDSVHAEKAIEILNAWSSRLWGFDGNDAKLIAALTGQHFVNAAEILRYTDAGWKEEDIETFTKMMLTVFYPVMEDFFAEANGNWDAAMINTLLGIGVFTDRPDIFEKAVDRFYWGPTNGGITKYIYPNGQCQESIRDWPHVQLGLGEFAKAAQVAWTQGLDFFGVSGNRLALGFEYTAKYMLGSDVPVYGPISSRGRGNFRDIYEPVLTHYTLQRGMAMPYTENAIKETRPTSGLGFLSAQRVPATAGIKSDGSDTPLAKAQKQTGAEKNPTYERPNQAIFVKPGQSVQDALNRAAANKGWVILGKGIHVLTETIHIPSGVTLAGEGLETVLWLEGSVASLTVKSQQHPASAITIRDMVIEGATNVDPGTDPNQGGRSRSRMSAPSREGIVFSGEAVGSISQIQLENLTVRHFTKHGVSIRGASDVRVINCDFSDNGSNVVPGEGLHHNLHLIHVRGAVVENSRFSSSPWGSGLYISHSGAIQIANNEFSRNRRHGVQLLACENTTVENNLFEGNDGHGLFATSRRSEPVSAEIRNNLLRNNGGAGLRLDDPDKFPMQPNLLVDNRVPEGATAPVLTDEELSALLKSLNLDDPALRAIKQAEGNHVLAARELLAYFRQRQPVLHPMVEEKANEADLALADSALRHVMRGQPAYPLFDVGRNIDWGARPVPDNEWVWQLNRMTFWTAIAKAYSATGNSQYVSSYAHQLTDWVRKNPRDEQHGYAWRSIEAGIRGYAWTGHFLHFLHAPEYTPEVLIAFLKSCQDHAQFLMTSYKTGSNWALMEAEGMAFVAMTFPEFTNAETWLKEAVDRLNQEITKQVYPDGHQRELAFGYHTGSIAWFLRTYEMAKRVNKDSLFSENYLDLIEKMCEVPMKLAFPNGTTPQFGDAWTGRPGQYYASLKKWNQVFGRPDFLYVATEGAAGVIPDATAFAYPYSGLYSMRSSWKPDAISLVLKCGPDGGGHSHPDNGTFELYAGGRSLMPDSGSFIYSGDPEGRAWFRQTKVHQTLTLDGENAAYAPTLHLWKPGENVDQLVVENQSYPDLAHRRAVLFIDKAYFIIIDEALGKASGVLDLNFQLAPGPYSLDPGKLTAQTRFNEGYNVKVQTQQKAEITMVEAEGKVSFIYTQKEPRPAFSFQVEKNAKSKGYRFLTVIIPFKETLPQISVKLLGNPKLGARSYDLEINEDGTTRYERVAW
nr:DUF1565 domain-containing protein [Cytophagales bacterium]